MKKDTNWVWLYNNNVFLDITYPRFACASQDPRSAFHIQIMRRHPSDDNLIIHIICHNMLISSLLSSTNIGIRTRAILTIWSMLVIVIWVYIVNLNDFYFYFANIRVVLFLLTADWKNVMFHVWHQCWLYHRSFEWMD